MDELAFDSEPPGLSDGVAGGIGRRNLYGVATVGELAAPVGQPVGPTVVGEPALATTVHVEFYVCLTQVRAGISDYGLYYRSAVASRRARSRF